MKGGKNQMACHGRLHGNFRSRNVTNLTNDSPSTVGRMIDIGIPSYLLASSLTMVLSQRLGRRLCQKCKKPTILSEQRLLEVGFTEEQIKKDDFQLYKAVGCAVCNGLGYKGRVGFFELMTVNAEVAKAIQAELPEEQLRKIATQEGMVPLRQAGLLKAMQGVTDVEEVLRRTVVHEDTMPSYLLNPDIEEYEDGDVIIQEGNKEDNNFYKLIRGKVAVLKKGKKIAEITEPGEYFGEMACILGEERYASVISSGRCKIKRYPGEKLSELIEKYPDISHHLFKTLANRLRKTDNIVVQLASGKGGGGARKGPRPRIIPKR